MSGGWKDIVKNGWHPEKSGSTLKSQVKGLVGRGETSSDDGNHVAAPRSSLRDPSSFGPPPKHVATYRQITTPMKPPTGVTSSYTPPPSSPQGQPYQTHKVQNTQEEPPPSEPKPYRVNTTGLSTSHLPPPPTRCSGADTPQLPPARLPTPRATTQAASVAKAPPSLPPRLPPRSGNSTPSPTSASEQAASQGYLNQGAISRLGTAGISVSELGIGRDRTPPPPLPPGVRPSPPLTRSPTQAPGYGQVDELQARSRHMGTSSPQVSPNGTAAGGAQQPFVGQVPSALGKKKPPPPPPSKKPGLSGTRESADTPPPIPLATRPRSD
ncbi:hypothetical protein GGR58DRAFT_505073 [Xylaria digitata]|nr:hypothetical protein GGR58DRAFT_505073 [Xylaria digitata]